MSRWLVFDTETTGLLLPNSAPLDQQPKIIEFALVALEVDDKGTIVQASEHSWMINPGEPLPEIITKITGLTDADLKDKPPFSDVLPEITQVFLGTTGLVAHNLPFDLGMLTNELRRLGKEFAFPYPPKQLCTVSAYHHVKGRRMKMTELYEHVMKKPLAQKHRALDDVHALVEILIADETLA